MRRLPRWCRRWRLWWTERAVEGPFTPRASLAIDRVRVALETIEQEGRG